METGRAYLAAVREKAYAKVNLALDVVGKRVDGYHDVRMVMQTLDLYDTVKIERTRRDGHIELIANGADMGPDEDNLVYKAAEAMLDVYRAMKEEAGDEDRLPGVKITLDKRIPVAAGLAGGSADAAATLRGMNRLLEMELDEAELCRIGRGLGADVPFCVRGGTQLAEGIGDELKALPELPEMIMVVVRPDLRVSTPEVYEAYDAVAGDAVHPDVDAMVAAIEAEDDDAITKLLGNVLETVTETQYPIIGDIKSAMMDNGAVAALMSGSGPSVFGIFETLYDAEQAVDAVVGAGLAFESDCFVTEPAEAGEI